jgi:hypothetical protein
VSPSPATTAAEVASAAEVLDWVQRIVGPIEKTDTVGLGRDGASIIRAHLRSDHSVVVKWCQEAGTFHRLVEALSLHAPALGAFAPKLVDASETFRAVIMTDLPGVIVEGTPEAWDPVVHFRVGGLIRLLHESGPTMTNTHLAAQWAAELDGAAKRAEPYLDPTALASARADAMRLLDIGTLRLVPAHRSNHPAHWMYHPTRGVALVGFSKSEYDPWIVDAVRLARDYWGYSPELERAFYSGYDMEPSDEDRLILRVRSVTDALTSWAGVHEQRTSQQKKREVAKRIDHLFGQTLF